MESGNVADLSSAETNMKTYENYHEKLLLKIKNLQGYKRNYESLCKQLEELNVQVAETMEQHDKEIEDLSLKNASLIEENLQLKDENSTLKLQMNTQRAIQAEDKLHTSRIEQQLNKAAEVINFKDDQHAKMNIHLKELELSNESLVSKLRSYNSVKEELDRIETKMEHTIREKLTADDEILRLNGKINEMEEINMELESRNSVLIRQNEECNEIIETLKKRVEKMKQEKLAYKTSAKSIHDTVVKQSKFIEKKTNYIDKQQQVLNEMKESKMTNDIRITVLQKSSKRKEQQIREKDDMIKALESKIHTERMAAAAKMDQQPCSCSKEGPRMTKKIIHALRNEIKSHKKDSKKSKKIIRNMAKQINNFQSFFEQFHRDQVTLSCEKNAINHERNRVLADRVEIEGQLLKELNKVGTSTWQDVDHSSNDEGEIFIGPLKSSWQYDLRERSYG